MIQTLLPWLYTKYSTLIGIIAVIIGLIILDHTYLMYSILLGHFAMSIVILYDHEGLSHHYITPRNKLLDILMFFITALWCSGPLHFYKRHIDHHINWKNPDTDYIEHSVNQGILLHALGLTEMSKFPVEYINHFPVLTQYKKDIVFLFACFLLAISPTVLFYFWLLPWVYTRFWLTFITESLQHGFQEFAHNERDFWFIIPIFGQFGVHHSHHLSTRKIVYAPRNMPLLKWLNPHFYLAKLLFTETK